MANNELTEALREKINKTQKELEVMCRLEDRFPDLLKETDRRGAERLYSEHVNAIADQYEERNVCSCCSDASIIIMPYIIVDETKVFTKPIEFYVGQSDPYSKRDRIHKDWKESLMKAGVNQKIIDDFEERITVLDEDYEVEE